MFGLRIFNPDGSEAEKSGHGLRIFSRYLWEKGFVKETVFTVNTLGGNVKSQVFDRGKLIRIEMGKVSFNSEEIPVTGETGDCIQKQLELDGKFFTYNAATIGNPHCVIIMEDINPEIAKKYGSLIEVNPKFPNWTNVQFMKVIDDHSIQIEIWERGTGYTLASGSSSTAAAAVAFKLNKCPNNVRVRMQGGELSINFTDDFNVTMTGPVKAVYDGEFKEEMIEEIKKRIAAGNKNVPA